MQLLKKHFFGQVCDFIYSSFEEVSTPGQKQTELGPRVYCFITAGCCTT